MKKVLRRALVGLAMGASAFAGLPATAVGSSYPNKPVRIVVPYAPGGAVDAVSRMVAARLASETGQPFIVENKPGGGGVLAAGEVARAPADGYTLLTADIQQTGIMPFLFSELPFNMEKDLRPISLMISMPLFLMVPADSKITNLNDLADTSKSTSLMYATPGVGSVHHITMESLRRGMNFDITHVPYKGASQVVAGFLAGDVPVAMATYGALAPHEKTGKGKFLAVTTLNRTPLAPDVPTVSEVIPEFNFSSEIGLMAPAGTPPEIISKLSALVIKALREPENKAKLASMGADVVASTPEAYESTLKRNREIFAEAVRLSGAKAE